MSASHVPSSIVQSWCGMYPGHHFPSTNQGLRPVMTMSGGFHPLPPQASLYPQHLPPPTPMRQTFLQKTMDRISPESLKNLKMVAITLRRPSQSDPWGIAFSSFDDRVVVGRMKDYGRKFVRWSHCMDARDARLDPRTVFWPMWTRLAAPGGYSNHLYAHTLRVATHDKNSMVVQGCLAPGDLVVGVDGLDTAYFQNLTALSDYLRQRNECTLLVLRHVDVSQATIPFADTPSQAATAADHAWQAMFRTLLTIFPSQVSTHHLGWNSSSIPRQITPDKYTVAASQSAPFPDPRALFSPSKTKTKKSNAARNHKNGHTKMQIPASWRNPWFLNEKGEKMPFDDNLDCSLEDGTRARLFLPPIANFSEWLNERKHKWRRNYKVYAHASEARQYEASVDMDKRTVSLDFWSPQGFPSFDEWLVSSIKKWKPTYSWNRRKTQRIQKECEAVVHMTEEPRGFQHWLRTRRNQWRLQRRKRYRERLDDKTKSDLPSTEETANEDTQHIALGCSRGQERPRKRVKLLTPELTDIAAIDDLIEKEEQERKRLESAKRGTLDIKFLFDASEGAPDDIVVHCLSFLEPVEYSKLLCISKKLACALIAREDVWRLLCPSHWILPRRPRKPWHELYFHMLRTEQRNTQKRWDDLLVKISSELFKGDHCQKVEKMISKAEKEFGFDVNYVSPVVCERNSILNLAVIHRRHKVVRWLVDQKGADIESYDRGHFTALLNAAWAGDRQMVRFLLQRGASRNKIGYNHYTKGLAPLDFGGMTAEGWARHRGFDEVADLIRLGL